MKRYADAAERKIKAIELMKKLDIYKPYIEGFEKDNMVCFYENFGGFWAIQEPEIQNKMINLLKGFSFNKNLLFHKLNTSKNY